MSIKKSLSILLIISSIIPVVLVSVIAYGLLTNRLISAQSSDLKRMAETNRSGLEAMIERQKTEISILSLQEPIINILRHQEQDRRSSTYVNDLLKSRKNSNKDCIQMSIVNLDGTIISSSDSSAIGTDSQANLTLTYISATKSLSVAVGGISQMNFDGKDRYTIVFGSPIIDSSIGSDKIIGYILSTIDLCYFKELLDNISLGITGQGILLDKDGTILYHHDPALIGTNINSEKLSSLVDNYNKGFLKESGTFEYYYNKSTEVYGYSMITEPGWVLLVKQNISELRSITTIMLSLLFVICAVLIIIIAIFANTLAKKFSKPIIALRDAMRTASNGDLTVQTNIRSKNELGELSKNFNKMLHIIKTNYEDLASMHEELLANEEQLRANYDHIEYLAYHDPLTNLPNKLAFMDYINAALITYPHGKAVHAVYFVDLDNFKTVNDTLGHEYGDGLLMKAAQELNSLLTGKGILARTGGDEFLIFSEDISSKENALSFAQDIMNHFRKPLDLNGEMVYLSMSIGIALYPDNGLTPNALIKNADIAMYKSKETGKNKFTLFDSRMEEELNRNTLIIDILRNAIENKEIYIQYQPQLDIKTNTITGFEALMRIKSDRLGYLQPEEFIPIAEESGFIIELSSWLIKEACSFNKKLMDQGLAPRPVSVNISSIQINSPDFLQILEDILKETGLPPNYLELEITESSLVSSITDTTKLLNDLKNIGIRISLDDFGTGYSSLNYLTNMPIDTLKIDKTFIDHICENEKDTMIAQSIIQLAHSLCIKVIAEGVEEECQLELLKSLDCDIIQGFIFSGPLYPHALVNVICNL